VESLRSIRRPAASSGVSAADPTTVFVVKSLLNPVVAVLALGACAAALGESLRGPYFLVAVLGFIGAAELLGSTIGGAGGWRDSVHRLLDLLVRWVAFTGCVWALVDLSGFGAYFDLRVLGAWAIATPFATWSAQIAANLLMRRPTLPMRKAVIVGCTPLGVRLESSVRADALMRTEIAGYFEDRPAERMPAGRVAPLIGRTRDVVDYVLRNDINFVYVTLPMTREPRVTALLDGLRDSTVSIYFVPDLFAFSLIQGRFDLIDGIPLVAVRESPFYGVRALAKRITDILVAGAAALVLAPVLVLVAAGVKLTSPGPVIFRQRRYGLDGKSITVYKFRSMTVTEDGDRSYTQVTRGDARVTPFGEFIRRTSLDELPQLFNVLEGSMSIVGPRPHAVAVNEQYRRLIPGYMVRHKVKPGITGWAQVNGYRGGDDLGSMTKRIEFDLEYLRRWSLWLDIHILFRTALMVLNDKRAF
jgi:putative colanic acid biosysnthesis UDP-glucose lipid carrier transferase